jgi:methionyl-tRNA formyltransferase
MRVVFVGTPEFSLPTLRKLAESEHDVVRSVTRRDSPKGRGRKQSSPPVKIESDRLGIPVLQPKSINAPEILQTIAADQPELIVTAACSFILGGELLRIPKHGCINLHPSLLPKYRGVAPIQWAIVHGEKTTGVTTMMMDEGIDTGDVLLQETIEIGDDETAGELHDRLSVMGADLIMETIERLEQGDLPRAEQDDSKSSYAPKLKKSDGIIDWDKSARKVHDLIRGMTPWPGAQTSISGEEARIWKSRVIDLGSAVSEPGTVIDITEEGIAVATNPGAVMIVELQPAGKKVMHAFEFSKGRQLNKGDSLRGD